MAQPQKTRRAYTIQIRLRSTMPKLMALRFYFPHSARASHSRLWHHLSRPALAAHLLKLARRHGISQATLIHVEAGYLQGDIRVRQRHVELTHTRLPQCLELIDAEETIRAFVDAHQNELANVRVLLLPCEPVMPASQPEQLAKDKSK